MLTKFCISSGFFVYNTVISSKILLEYLLNFVSKASPLFLRACKILQELQIFCIRTTSKILDEDVINFLSNSPPPHFLQYLEHSVLIVGKNHNLSRRILTDFMYRSIHSKFPPLRCLVLNKG